MQDGSLDAVSWKAETPAGCEAKRKCYKDVKFPAWFYHSPLHIGAGRCVSSFFGCFDH